MVNPGKDKELKAHIRSELERGIKPGALAEYTKVPKNTIRRWRRNLERHGSMDALPSGSTGRGKSLTTEQEHYLLGYMHGRPDAYLTEMQKILKEAFDIDVSLPTISRTLKMKGCTKGFNKTRHIRTATKAPVQDQMNGSHPDGSSSQPSPEKHNPGQGVDVAPIMAFEKNLERHLEQHFEQNPTNGVALNGTALGPAMGVPVHQYQPKKSTQSQTHCPEHDISLSVAPANSTQTNTNGAIDPALG